MNNKFVQNLAYSLGKHPSFGNSDFVNGELLGYTRNEEDYIDNVEEFEIDTEWT